MAIFAKHAPNREPRYSAWDPAVAKERSAVLKMMLQVLALTTAALWCFQSIYFGAYYRQEQNAYRLTVRVLDMDSQYASQTPGAPAAILGPAVTQAIQQDVAMMPNYHLGWQIAQSDELQQLRLTEFGQGLNASEYAMDLVLDQTVFAVILINPNATRLATEAAQQGIATYDPRGAITFIYSEGRNLYSSNQYVSLLSTKLLESAISQASSRFASQYIDAATGANGATTNATAFNTALASSALTYPFYFNEHNLRPYDQLSAEAPTTAALIYLVIFTFFSTPIWKKAFGPLSKRLNWPSFFLLEWGVSVVVWFWISLCYSLITLAFGTDFTRKYGYGGFPLFWAMNWTTMCALGLVMQTMLRIAGPLYFPFFLVLWVIINVSVVFLDVADMDHFYSYAFVSPVWNAVDAAKSIIFGTKFHLTQNFLVCLAWIAVMTPILLFVAGRQKMQEEKKAYQSKVSEFREKTAPAHEQTSNTANGDA